MTFSQKTFQILLPLWLLLHSADSHSLLMIEPFLGFDLGGSDLNETQTTEGFDHDSFLIGLELGARTGFNFKIIQMGAMGMISAWQMNGTREENTQGATSTSGYDNTLRMFLWGPYFAIKPLQGNLFRVIGEYYPDLNIKATYSEANSANFLAKNDKLTGSGFGFGFTIPITGRVGSTLVYRQLTINKFRTSEADVDLPSDNFSKFKVWEASMQGSYLLD